MNTFEEQGTLRKSKNRREREIQKRSRNRDLRLYSERKTRKRDIEEKNTCPQRKRLERERDTRQERERGRRKEKWTLKRGVREKDMENKEEMQNLQIKVEKPTILAASRKID